MIDNCRELYLELLKKSLTGLIYEDKPDLAFPIFGHREVAPERFIKKLREFGRDLPSQAFSAIGLERMNNLQFCVEKVLVEQVPGDLIETGVWRGGATIFMRGILKAYGINDRTVWVADSFEGLPSPNLDRYPADKSWQSQAGLLAVSQEEVQCNFERYGLLDEQVRFLKGWFSKTLPHAPIEQLAVLRLDGDLYESTMDALSNLYPKLAPGGFVIIDDYVISSCSGAVDKFRQSHDINDPLIDIDGWSVYWRRSK